MHTFLVVVIVSGCFGLISAGIPTSIIDSDLAEIGKLEQDFKNFSPPVVRRMTETTCQMLSQCCPQMQSTFVSMIISGDMDGLMKKCFGETGSSTFLSKILSCRPLTKLTALATNPQITKYVSIITNKQAADKEEMKSIVEVCSEKEMHSIACDWDTSDQHDSCERKVLQKWAEQDDGKTYANKVQQSKEGYIKIIDQLKKEFKN
jgi:hypothetical protein